MKHEQVQFTRADLEVIAYGKKEDGIHTPGLYGEKIQLNTERGENIIGRCDGFDQPMLDDGKYASAHFIVTSNGGEAIRRHYVPINTIRAIWVHRPKRWEGDDN